MTIEEDVDVIERAAALPPDRQRVYPGTPEFAVLIRHCRHVAHAAWRSMSARHRWAWLVYLTAPGITDEEAEQVVDEAAAECADGALERIDAALSLADRVRREAVVEETNRSRARADARLKQAFRQYDDQRRTRLRDAEFWNLADAAFMLEVAESTVSRWIKAGLRAEKVWTHARSHTYLMRADDVRTWAARPDRRKRRPKRP